MAHRPVLSSDRSTHEERTDVAALAAAIVAVAVAMFVEPGPFMLLGVALVVTLMCVLAGYVLRNSRPNPLQSLAVAAIVGLLAIPVIGFSVEMGKANNWESLLIDNDPGYCPDNAKESKSCNISRVNNLWTIGTWVGVGGLVYFADRRQQKRRIGRS